MSPRVSPDGVPLRRVRRRRSTQARARRRRRTRRALLVTGLGVALLAGWGAWLVVTGLGARADLQTAQQATSAATTALLAGDAAQAQAQVDVAVLATGRAQARTHGPAWDLAAAVPWAGRPAVQVRRLTEAVAQLGSEVIAPAGPLGARFGPQQLRPEPGRIDLAVLDGAREPLAAMAEGARRVAASVDAAGPGYLPPLEEARDELSAQVHQLADLLGAATTAATILPPVLGQDGPRSYFVGFQTNAEARGTGGLVGAFGILSADAGAVSFTSLDSNVGLQDLGARPLDLGEEYDLRYGAYGSTVSWANSNLSPHFPSVARTWVSLWEQSTGQRLDGAIATDPVALSYLLGATGPVTLPDGQVVDTGNAVPLTLAEVYARFPDDNTARKDYLQSVADAVVEATLAGGGGSTVGIVRALARATEEGRLAVWSAVPGEQQVLGATPLGHELPETSAPYAGLVVNNAAGSKLDYYLARELRYTGDGCADGRRRTTVTATLRNDAPAGLPGYVLTRADDDPQGPPGSNRLLVSLYATAGARLTSVTVDGVPTTVRSEVERGHPVYTLDLVLPPGVDQVLTYSLDEPDGGGEPVVPVQPLVQLAEVVVDLPPCARAVG